MKDNFKPALLTGCFRSDIYVARVGFGDRIPQCFVTLLHKEREMNFERRNYEDVRKRNFA
jgi:hypothetical protein